jgi:hypothetical protein
MPAQHPPGGKGNRAQISPPVTGWLGYLDLGYQRVACQFEQMLLAGLQVQRHGPRPQGLSDSPHAQSVCALGIRDGDRQDSRAGGRGSR